jgi:hypothetical protein
MTWQIRCRIFIVAITVVGVLGVSGRAVTNWVTKDALGDVLVSFDGRVEVRANANAALKETINPSELTGTNGHLAFDDSLNLWVVNTDGDQLVKLVPGSSTVETIDTQDAPKALAIAKDGTIYVASAGNPTATIRRIAPGATCAQNDPCPQFTVPTDSSLNLCIGIDLDDQNTMYYVSGERKVRSVANVNSLGDGTVVPITSAPVFANLNGNGTACGLRVLAPLDVRTPATSPTPLVGGVVVADGDNVRLVSGSSQTTFNLSGNKNFVDVAVDSKGDIWAVNAGSNNLLLVRYRIGNANPQASITLTSTPRGVAINGEQRYARTIRNLQLTATQESSEAEFLEGTPWEHAWRGNFSAGGSIAIQATEVRPEPKADEQPTNDICPPSLYIDCRLSLFNPFRLAIPPVQSATPKTYTHNRSVFYREILRTSALASATAAIGIRFSPDLNTTDESAGQVCSVGGTPKKASAMVRDPWPHTLFSYDPTFVFYGGDDVIRTKTSTTNDTILVERDALYFMRIIKPDDNSNINLGSVKQVAVEVRRPSDCSLVTGLETRLVLAVTDITNGIDTLIGDSIGAYGTLAANGLTWASTTSQYRTNVPFTSPTFVLNHTYRVCVAAGAAASTQETSVNEPAKPLAAEACVDVTMN